MIPCNVKKNQDRLKDTIISVNQKIRDDKREEIFIIQLLYLRTHADDNLKDSIKRLKDTSLSIYLSTMYLSINLAYQNIQLISVSNLDISNRSIMDGHLILSQILEYARQNSEKYA